MKKVLLTMISTVLLSLAVTFAATISLSDTPLYTYRMEQASSEMGFLPAKMNEFTYNTEKGFELVFIVAGCCDVEPCGDTWYWTCSTSTCYRSTCGGVTCWNSCEGHTCQSVCGTCYQSCGGTCDTCGESPWTCTYSTCQSPC